MNKEKYGVEQIRTLEGIEAIRLRPGMFIGSIGPEGVQHITLEIISNVVDEYLNGHCTKCGIKVEEDGTIYVSDNGRGVPFGKAEDGSETLVNVYTKLHTGAKFDSSGKTGYNTSGGMNGVGAKATNALSEHFKVMSIRENKVAIAEFKEGKLLKYEVSSSKDKTIHGTVISFKPDKKIFKEGIELNYNKLKEQIKQLAYLSPGLVFNLNFKGKEETITSQNGIKDYIEELNQKKNNLTSVFYTETMKDRVGVKIAMQYNDSYSDTYKLFTNSIPNSSGTHLTGFRTALTQQINEYAREEKLLKEKDNNITGEELKEGLTLVLSFIMPDPVFSGQTKDVLTSSEARTIVQRLVSSELRDWLKSHPKDAKAIVSKALVAREAREKAKKAKETVRKLETKTKNKTLNLPTKLVDSWSKKREECELLISEGDSAAAGLIGARDGEFQAVFPIRGKLLNLYKASNDKIFNNQEIVNIIKALGLELDPKTNKIKYDKKKLRYGKIILCADADPDGQSIRNLLLTCFWFLCPELVINGHIYSAIPPLFRITTKKNEYIYLKDSIALEEYKKAHQGEKYLVNRNKGLGEQDASELEECLLNPKTRNVIQLLVGDKEEANKLFEIFMGTSAIPRKEWIFNHSEEANIE